MGKYVISIQPEEACNPEFAPDKNMQGGLHGDGFVLIMFKDGKAHTESIMGVSIKEIMEWLRLKTQTASVIRQGCAIAEGYMKADKIRKEQGSDFTEFMNLFKFKSE